MAQREGQVIGEAIDRPVALVKNAPAVFYAPTAPDMAFRDGTRGSDRRLGAKAVHQLRAAGEPCAFWHKPVLEH